MPTGMLPSGKQLGPYEIVSLLGAGVFEWLPKWFDPADPRASGALADEYCRLFIAGLRRR